MKNIRKWWLPPVTLTIVSTIFGYSVVSALNSQNNKEVVVETFYGVSSELTTELEKIVLADNRITELIKDRVFTLHAGSETIEVKTYQLAVGVRLDEKVTHEVFIDWVNNGRHDSDIIKEYVGSLSIGYNKQYVFSIDKFASSIGSLEIIKDFGDTIPEVSGEQMQAALDIAFADSKVQSVLTTKSFTIHGDRIGAWHERSRLIGVSFMVEFDMTYIINEELPDYSLGSYSFSGKAVSIIVNVSLEENRVGTILVQKELGL